MACDPTILNRGIRANRIANETHYIDADTCLWQNLDDDIALVLPDYWNNVYSEDN